MSPTIYDLGIDKMSPQDRLRLIGEIWDTLEPPIELSEAHWREIEDRIAHADANPGVGSSLEDVMARLLAKR
ncbi:MAG TPA: addiction module protein [Urbifossiella sp.]|jgi:putative addiction module component (TIGR02574 family)|nr:addiction module protein [Urbifossiella sp.]